MTQPLRSLQPYDRGDGAAWPSVGWGGAAPPGGRTADGRSSGTWPVPTPGTGGGTVDGSGSGGLTVAAPWSGTGPTLGPSATLVAEVNVGTGAPGAPAATARAPRGPSTVISRRPWLALSTKL